MASRNEISSAQARLDRLLPHIGRLPRPDPNQPTLYERELLALELSQRPPAQNHGFDDGSNGRSDKRTTKAQDHKSHKHGLKISRPKEDNAARPSLTVQDPGLPKIEYLPHGKQPLHASTHDIESKHQSMTGTILYYPPGKEIVSRFCSFSLLAKFPYKYLSDPDSLVSQNFFARNKFYDRSWELYYLHPPSSVGGNALVLVPFSQAQDLVSDICRMFQIDLTVPDFPFTLPFCDDGSPQPVLLGISESREDASQLQQNISDPSSDFGECPPGASLEMREIFEYWLYKFQEARIATKAKKGHKGLSTIQPQASRSESRTQLRRVQRYLGLSSALKGDSSTQIELPADGPEVSESDAAADRETSKVFLDVSMPAPHDPYSAPVIICVDVESDEWNHSRITEIGVSTLDTMDLRQTPLGPSGQNWVTLIRSRHFRIKGTEHIRNKKWCVGNPDSFEFGKTEWVSLADAAEVVDSCFAWPFSSKIHPGTDEHDVPHQRNIIFLGHGTNTDADYLGKLGSKIFGSVPRSPSELDRRRIVTNFVEILDTAVLDQTMRNAPQVRSLGKICEDVGVIAWNPHNAGNDARYTLEALVKLAIRARLETDEASKAADNAPDSVSTDSVLDNERQTAINDRMDRTRDDFKTTLEALEQSSDYEFEINFRGHLPMIVKGQRKYSASTGVPGGQS